MVAIKNFGMPSCCDNCEIFDCLDRECRITYTKCEEPFDSKNDDCPLIEIDSQESDNCN